MLNINISKDKKILSRKVCDYFINIHNSKSSSPRLYIMPGGNTPRLFYRLIAKKVNDWSETRFILSDERLVPKKDPRSNSSMLRTELINNIALTEKPVLIEYGKKTIPNDQIFSNSNYKIINNSKPVLAILGFGNDGHTASLFPEYPELFKSTNRDFVEVCNFNEPYKRLSLTFSMLMKAEKILFLISGKSKAEALRICLGGNYLPSQYPAQYIFRNYKNNITIFCDENAASKLNKYL